MDDSGNILVVWNQSGPEFVDIWSAKFDHSASTWTPAAKLENAAFNAYKTAVAVNSSGAATTIWLQADATQFHIYASRTTLATQPRASSASVPQASAMSASPAVSSAPQPAPADALFAVMASDGFASPTDWTGLLTSPAKSKPRSAVDLALLDLTAAV